jgi:photosystem II stability/assembly factor-like uncharacterized protein
MGPVATAPKENRLLVGVAGNSIYASADGAGSWSALGTGTGSESLTVRVTQFLFDPAHDDTFYVATIYSGQGLLKTTDRGKTFVGLGDAWHNDTLSVDFRDPQRKTLLAGTHEQSRVVLRSTDGGDTWTNIGANLPADSGWSLYVQVVNAQTHLVGCPGTGIYRTTNGGGSWTQVSKEGGGAPQLLASDGSIYWPSTGGHAMVRSTDDGVTWTQVTGDGVLYSMQPIELPDGRIATRGPRGVLVSSDHGEHWVAVAPPEPFQDPGHSFTLAYSAQEKAFFVAHSTCAASVPDDGLVRFDWDYEAK